MYINTRKIFLILITTYLSASEYNIQALIKAKGKNSAASHDCNILAKEAHHSSQKLQKEYHEKVEKPRKEKWDRFIADINRPRATTANTSSRYITDYGIDVPSYEWSRSTVWYKSLVSVSDGSHIIIKVDKYDQSCYSLLVVGDITGNCSNCSGNINGIWSCNVNRGAETFQIRGNQAEAANAIVQRSR